MLHMTRGSHFKLFIMNQFVVKMKSPILDL